MAKEIRKNGKLYYLCEVCGIAYEQKEWADRCQEWCESHGGSCNIEIIQHSMQLEEPEKHI